MTQHLRGLVLSENWSSFPATIPGDLKLPITPVSQNLTSSSDFLRHPHMYDIHVNFFLKKDNK